MRFGPLPPSFINTYSLDFDGVDDYVDVGEIPPLFKNFPIGTAKDNPWSASMWVKGSTSGAFLQLPYVETNIIGARAFAFAFTGTYLYFGGKFANIKIRESEPFAGGVTSFSTTDWNHVLMTFDGVDYTALSSYKLYVNGTLIPIELIPTNITDFRVKSILIGGTQLPWLGKIDEVSLFDAELTTSSVTSIYNGGKPTDLTPLNPIAWYRMGDNGAYKSPQWLLPSNENKDKVSNYSFDFDGVDDYVDCGNISELNGVTRASWSIWSAKGDTTDDYLMSCYSSTTSLQQYLFHQYSDRINIYLSNSGGTLRLMNRTSYTFNVGEWYHIGIVYNEAEVSNADKVKVYINGILQINQVAGFALTSLRSTTAITSIGRAVDFTTKEYNGNIDEVAIFNSAISIGDVWDGSGQPTDLSLLATPPVAWYKMGENATFLTNWTVPDEVGINDGTSANMTIEDRVGTAPSSSNNALSFNMDLVDRVTDVPT